MAKTEANHQVNSSRLPAISPDEEFSVMGFFTFTMGLAHDVLEGKITPSVCNAACNAAGRSIQILDLQWRLGNKKVFSE